MVLLGLGVVLGVLGLGFFGFPEIPIRPVLPEDVLNTFTSVQGTLSTIAHAIEIVIVRIPELRSAIEKLGFDALSTANQASLRHSADIRELSKFLEPLAHSLDTQGYEIGKDVRKLGAVLKNFEWYQASDGLQQILNAGSVLENTLSRTREQLSNSANSAVSDILEQIDVFLHKIQNVVIPTGSNKTLLEAVAEEAVSLMERLGNVGQRSKLYRDFTEFADRSAHNWEAMIKLGYLALFLSAVLACLVCISCAAMVCGHVFREKRQHFGQKVTAGIEMFDQQSSGLPLRRPRFVKPGTCCRKTLLLLFAVALAFGAILSGLAASYATPYPDETPSFCPVGLQLVSWDSDAKRDVVNLSALDYLKTLNGPLYTVSDSGAQDTGKTGTFSVFALAILPRRTLQRCGFSGFVVRTNQISEAVTKGIWVYILRISDLNLKDMPARVREAVGRLSSRGYLIWFDPEGTDNPDADDKGAQERYELLSILLSSHVTLAVNKQLGTDLWTRLARTAHLISVVERLTGSNCNVQELERVGAAKMTALGNLNTPSFGMRIRDAGNLLFGLRGQGFLIEVSGRIAGINHTLGSDMLKMMIEIPFSACSGDKEVERRISVEDCALIEKYLKRAREIALPQPTITDAELEFFKWFRSYPKTTADALNQRQRLDELSDPVQFGGAYGVLYSLVQHHIPFVIDQLSNRAKAFSTHGKSSTLASGDELASFIQVFLESASDLPPRYFMERSVSSVNHVVCGDVTQLVERWKDSTLKPFLTRLPLEAPISRRCVVDHLCPEDFFNDHWASDVERVILSQLCLRKAMIGLRAESPDSKNCFDESRKVLNAERVSALASQQSKCEAAYRWQPGHWGACFGECPGTQERTLACLWSVPGRKAANRDFGCCSGSITPNTSQPCAIEEQKKFRYEWRHGDFGACQQDGQHCGQKVRQVKCVRCNETVDDLSVCIVGDRRSNAALTAAPHAMEDCFEHVQWNYSAFSPDDFHCQCNTNQLREASCVQCGKANVHIGECRSRLGPHQQLSRACEGFYWDITDTFSPCDKPECGWKDPIIVCKHCSSGRAVDASNCQHHAPLSAPRVQCPCKNEWRESRSKHCCKVECVRVSDQVVISNGHCEAMAANSKPSCHSALGEGQSCADYCGGYVLGTSPCCRAAPDQCAAGEYGIYYDQPRPDVKGCWTGQHVCCCKVCPT